MTNNQQNNNFDLEDRTLKFSKRIVKLCKVLPKNTINNVYVKQIIRSSGSMGANYREANDSLSKKDFLHRMRIARKETKETLYWLELIEEANPEFSTRMQDLKQECREIKSIFSTIITKKEIKDKKI